MFENVFCTSGIHDGNDSTTEATGSSSRTVDSHTSGVSIVKSDRLMPTEDEHYYTTSGSINDTKYASTNAGSNSTNMGHGTKKSGSRRSSLVKAKPSLENKISDGGSSADTRTSKRSTEPTPATTIPSPNGASTGNYGNNSSKGFLAEDISAGNSIVMSSATEHKAGSVSCTSSAVKQQVLTEQQKKYYFQQHKQQQGIPCSTQLSLIIRMVPTN